jgi:hypothetical protein
MMRALTPISNVRGHFKPILFISLISFAMALAAYQFVVSNAGNRNFSGVWIFFSISYILNGKRITFLPFKQNTPLLKAGGSYSNNQKC